MATKTPLAEYSGTFRVMASGDTIPAAIVPTLNQNTTGSAAKLTTARSIALTGTVTGSASFDGSANASIATTVADNALSIAKTSGLQLALDGKVSSSDPAVTQGAVAFARLNNGTNTGYVVITLPYKTDATKMLSFQVRIYSGYVTTVYTVSGYLYAAPNNWNSHKVTLNDSTVSESAITTGRDVNGYAYVCLPVGVYAGVGIYDVTSGYYSESNLRDTTFTFSTTQQTDNSVTPVFKRGLDTANFNNVAPTLTGTGASGTWGISITGNAATATALATARTINGTSFNGSANITTANWGTARTLTIGSTGKSVNGSGNVSWSLAEIGAITDAPSDGKTYGRKDAAWVEVGGAKVTGTTITGASNTLGSGNLNTLVEYVGTNSGSGVYIPTGLGTHADIINILNAHPYSYDLYLYPQSGVALYKGGSSVSSVIIKANTLVSVVRMSTTNKWLVM